MDTERKWVTHLKDCIRKGAKDKRMISNRWTKRKTTDAEPRFCPMMTAWIGTGKVDEFAAYNAAIESRVSLKKINDDINEGMPDNFVEVFVRTWDEQPITDDNVDFPVERALEVVDEVAGHFDDDGKWVEVASVPS